MNSEQQFYHTYSKMVFIIVELLSFVKKVFQDPAATFILMPFRQFLHIVLQNNYKFTLDSEHEFLIKLISND